MTPVQIAAVDEAFQVAASALERRKVEPECMLLLAATMISSVAGACGASPLQALADVTRYMADLEADANEREAT